MKYRIFSAKENTIIGLLDFDQDSQLTTIKLDEKFVKKYKQAIAVLIDNFVETSYPSAQFNDTKLTIKGTKDDFIKYLSQEFQIRLQIILLKANRVNRNGFGLLLLVFVCFVLLSAISLVVLRLFATDNKNSQNLKISDIKNSQGEENPFSRRYSAGKCQGEGTTTFAYSPMKIEDIGQIEPYGVVVDAHVIPTSHGYISPIEFRSERDKYPVFAPADGFIVHISHRGQFVGDHQKDRPTDEYQMYFEHSCTFYSYYDLLTSLAPEIEDIVGKLTGFEQKQVRIPIKAGQLVGRVGGQTVDFAVWNFEREPAYFANPESYREDEDRFYLEDMFAFFKEPLKTQLLSKNRRTAEPRTGKVAYDIEGKLIGNWFKEGSGGFRGPKDIQKTPGGRYWDGHLAIVYDYIDPARIRFSIGNFEGKAAQFSVRGNKPDPKDIGVESGLIKYELLSRASKETPDGIFSGTALLQLMETSKLKLEIFPGKNADEINDFTNKALIYER